MSVKCKQCETENIDGAKFCTSCGANIAENKNPSNKQRMSDKALGYMVMLGVVIVIGVVFLTKKEECQILQDNMRADGVQTIVSATTNCNSGSVRLDLYKDGVFHESKSCNIVNGTINATMDANQYVPLDETPSEFVIKYTFGN